MGTFFNGANCNIYIGKGAGKMLLDDIQNAKKSVKIVSPYLSPFLIKELIDLKRKRIDIQLITSDNIEDFREGNDKNILKLIHQETTKDPVATSTRNKWIVLNGRIFMTLLALCGAELTLAYFFRDQKVLWGIAPIFILLAVFFHLKWRISNKKIYLYNYVQLFPFKVYLSPQTTKSSDTFIHSKIYIIDDSIAYLGSLNFTSSGTKFNYETRIKTTDKAAVDKILEEFFWLFNDSNLPERDLQNWGRELYDEPIN